MTAPAGALPGPLPRPLPDPTCCPECSSALLADAGGSACTVCGLRLTGPDAARLWQVDVRLLQLDGERRTLWTERAALLRTLRGASPAPLAAMSAQAAESSPRRVQSTLLGLGGLLLAVAATVFTAVTYDRLGAGGRAAVLVALTVLAGGAAPVLRRRGLTGTAGTLGLVAVVLAALDAYGLRRWGLASGTSELAYWAAGTGVLAVLTSGYAGLVPQRGLRLAAVGLAQVPLPLLLADRGAGATTWALALTGWAALDLTGLALLRARHGRWATDQRIGLCAAAIGVGSVALPAALAAAEERPAGSLTLVALAVLLAGASLLAGPSLRVLLSAGTVGLLALAGASALPDRAAVDTPALTAAVSAVALAGATLFLPRPRRTGPVLGALAVAAVTLLTVSDRLLHGLLAPLSWLLQPWTLPATGSARDALAPGDPWLGALATPLVVLAAAAVVLLAGYVLRPDAPRGLRLTAPTCAALLTAGLALAPLGLDVAYPAALGWLLALAACLVALSSRLRSGPELARAALPAASVALALAVAWSTADQTTTLVVLPTAAAVALAAAALHRPHRLTFEVAAGTGAALAAGWVGALGAAHELSPDQVGALLVAAAAVLVAGSLALHRIERGVGTEVAAAATAATAAVLAAQDAGWLSWVLAGSGLLALAMAVQPHRRPVALVGALLLSGSSAVRLLDAGVTAPEPYVLPLAALALLLGWLRRRTQPTTRSWPAYAPGLGLALAPSLLATLDDASPVRGLLLAAAATVVLLLGARYRLQAPLVIGGTVLALDALQLMSPYALSLPRWASLGTAGVLLVVVGATYEQRRRDLARMRSRYEQLA